MVEDDEFGFTTEFEETKTSKDYFKDLIANRTPNNIAAYNLAKELMEQDLGADNAYRTTLGILNYVNRGAIVNFSTMNMRLLAFLIIYVTNLPGKRITTQNFDSPELTEQLKKLIRKKDKAKYVEPLKRDLLRYARHLYIAENFNVPGIFNKTLTLTEFTLSMI